MFGVKRKKDGLEKFTFTKESEVKTCRWKQQLTYVKSLFQMDGRRGYAENNALR